MDKVSLLIAALLGFGALAVDWWGRRRHAA